MRVLRWSLRFVAVVVVTSLLVAVGISLVAPQAGHLVTATDSTAEELQLDLLNERSLVYAGDGTVLATLHGDENRSPVKLADMPEEFVQAILTIEDENFYSHSGVDLTATMRALFENVSAGSIEQGGSTITQQLVKNALLTPEQDFNRKAQEVILAYRLEDELSKDDILERYLNTVYFGGGAYGVQAAAEIYWQKANAAQLQELGWAEAALLAALIKNPVGYDPIRFPELAEERRQLVLDTLADNGVITEAEADEYGRVPLPTSRKAVLPPPEDYFVEEVKSQLLRDPRLGESYQERENAVFRGGLRIHTTLNPLAQQMAEQSVADVLPDGIDPFTAALVSIEPTTGAVRAMVGGPGFETYKYNLATHAPGRQTGSSFKFFVLLAALESGVVPSDNIGGGGAFPNPGGQEDPYVIDGKGGTISSVTAGSSNGAFVRLGQVVGLDNVTEVARRLGVTSALDPGVISMPLGVFDTRPIEMASAFSTVANAGVRNPPFLVQRVEDRFGNVIFEQGAEGDRAVSKQTACLAAQVLQGVVTGGTGTAARLGGQPMAGKTGTTQNYSDAWFVGVTPYLSTAVWMGDPNARTPMTNVGGIRVFGGDYPAEIVGAFMGAYHAELPRLEFPDCEKTRGGRTVNLEGVKEAPEEGSGRPAPRTDRDEADEQAEANPEPEDDGPDENTPPSSTPPSSTPPTSEPPPTSSPPTSVPGP